MMNMTKWEYKVETVPNMFVCEQKLAEHGENGWELVSVFESQRFYKIFLKRQKNSNALLG